MKRLVIIAIAVVLAWQGYANYQSGRPQRNVLTAPQPSSTPATKLSSTPAAKPQRARADRFKCDGRQHCSQMSSCEEATYFLKNCPGVLMDGDYDGVPCEKQLCR